MLTTRAQDPQWSPDAGELLFRDVYLDTEDAKQDMDILLLFCRADGTLRYVGKRCLRLVKAIIDEKRGKPVFIDMFALDTAGGEATAASSCTSARVCKLEVTFSTPREQTATNRSAIHFKDFVPRKIKSRLFVDDVYETLEQIQERAMAWLALPINEGYHLYNIESLVVPLTGGDSTVAVFGPTDSYTFAQIIRIWFCAKDAVHLRPTSVPPPDVPPTALPHAAGDAGSEEAMET